MKTACTVLFFLSLSSLDVPPLLRAKDDKGSMQAEAFQPSMKVNRQAAFSQNALPMSSRKDLRTAATQMKMCICVDCQWVTSCKAYHFVETKHEQPHMSEKPTFLPREGSPTINVNIRTEPKGKTGEARMWKDQQLPAGQAENENLPYLDENTADDPTNFPPGYVEPVSTNTITTIEYDVVKCADFVLDKGCWVRNMPDEIRKVNPDFVPT